MSRIIFNVIDWYENDEIDPEEGKRRIKKYIIRIFGRTEDDQSVAVKIENFTPFFFVEVPDDWDKKKADKFVERIKQFCEELDSGKRSYNGNTFDKNPKYNSRHLIAHDMMSKYKFYGFHADKKFKYIRLVFNNMSAMKRFARIFDNKIEFDNTHQSYRIYESNIDPYLRFMHIRDLDACGWVQIEGDDYDDNEEEATTNINVKCNWTSVRPVKDKIGIAPFKIASFDIECTSADGSFPQAHRSGDKIIQIGTSFSRYGSSEVYKKHIITLNTCNPIEGMEVVQCKDEREVLLAWQELIAAEDPDILTGYNIFYFDEKYMYDRCMLRSIDCKDDFVRLSKISEIECQFKEAKLSSSALGDNILRFFKTPGRVQIDLMKVVQRDHKLNSYKLDAVAEYFIKEPIVSLDTEDGVFVIKTKNTSAVKVGNFIKIEENGESIEEKLKVLQVGEDHIRAKAEIDIEVDTKAKLYWGLVKDDISPNDIFRLQKGSAEDRKLIAQYCIQDCVLVSKLMSKLDIIVNNISMANVCHVPMTYLFLRGQGIKSLSLVSKECRRKNYLIPVIKKKQSTDSEEAEEDVGYEGATVFEPEIGYHRIPVVVKDYNSLYPSSIIAYNMSHETIVFDADYDNLEDYTYMQIAFNNTDGTNTTCRYAKHKNGELGILPAILDKLIKERKSTRKQMESEVDPFKRTILDGKQLALKVTANSLYGQLGAATSPICMKELAASTTAVGRLMLETASKFVQGEFDDKGNRIVKGRFVEILETINECSDAELAELLDQELEDRDNTKFIEFMVQTIKEILDQYYVSPKVIYGDSVASYTPTILKADDRLVIETIDNIGKLYGKGGWKACDNDPEKEYCEINDVEVWTDDGWTKLQRVIRHNLPQHKKMMRVNTHCGVVDVTDDHSLLRMDKTEVSPKDLKVGDELLHNEFPYIDFTVNKISLDEARIMGMFMGDGSCGEYECKSGRKTSWAINNASMEMQKYYKSLCENVYPDYEWVIMDTLKSSGVYKLAPRSKEYGGIVKFVRKYRKMLYTEDKHKIVPSDILNAPIEVKRSFWDGFYDADGDKDENFYIRIDQKSQISAQTLAVLGASLGSNISLNTRKDKLDIYRVTMTPNKQRRNPNAIKKIHEIEYEGYVYDLTTENHHFAAGVGKMIVHNTDSIFIKMNITHRETKEVLMDRKALEWSIKLGQMSSKLLKKRIPPPENMEYEKTFWPFAIMAKKKYVGNKYEDNPHKFKQASMGIVLKRRDNANIVKKIIGGIIDIMMNNMDIDATIDYVKRSVKDMLAGKYPIKDFITTKTLKGSYKVKDDTVNIIQALMDEKELEGSFTPDMSAGERQKARDNHTKQQALLDQVSMTHVRLARRMAERDPGNKPMINERIPFVKVEKFAPRGTKLLQGDMVEHPDYIKQHNLKIDYLFYLTNQIVNPAVQILDLIIPSSKDEIFTRVIDKYKTKQKEREEIELRKQHVEHTNKTMNEFVSKYNWVKFDSDDDEMDSWMPIKGDITKLIDEVKAGPSKQRKKTARKKVVV